MKKHAIEYALALGLVAGLSGCAILNRADLQYSRTTTLGQELIDLKDARDRNVITEEEYDAAKKALLENPSSFNISCDALEME